MNYKEHLAKEHSRTLTDAIANKIGSDPIEFKKIIDIIFNEKAPLPQRASWILAVSGRSNPELITPYISKFIDSLPQLKIDGIKRNMLSSLCSQDIPKKLRGKIVNICFDFILDPEETVAVKVLCLEIVWKISQQHPELKNELKVVIEDQIPKTTAAFLSRGSKILRAIA
jgi:hypothetical protein